MVMVKNFGLCGEIKIRRMTRFTIIVDRKNRLIPFGLNGVVNLISLAALENQAGARFRRSYA